jgi:23S rRNA (guanine745-N1)-methyltransferase
MTAISSFALTSIPFICPLDGLPLALNGLTFTCVKLHSFDVSASGYVNLLPVQFKASLDPGDSKSMVAARRRVLDAGPFDPLAEAICSVVWQRVQERADEKLLLIDAGCGDGFYTARFAALLRRALPNAEPLVLGIDISKWAVMAAAKRHKDLPWAVASNKRLPVPQGAVSLITSLFGFATWPDWAKVQTLGQEVIVVDAGRRHLLELKEIIYPKLLLYDPPPHEEAFSSAYTQVMEDRISYQRTIPGPDLLTDLLEMTPHGHKSTRAGQESVRTLSGLNLSFEAVIRVFRRS